MAVGARVLITSGTRFSKFGAISLADDTYLNHDCYFDAEAAITIGQRCSIADHVRFVTATHEVGDALSRAGKNVGKPIVVGSGTWIGSSAVILPGVTIGSGCIIAAGAVVSRDCEPDGLYAGVPAVRLRSLSS
jgi:acetyltransferase-like isoleucine patch superfamily enzyme